MRKDCCVLGVFLLVAAVATSTQAQTPRQDQDACTSLVPAAMGGAIPTDRNTIVLLSIDVVRATPVLRIHWRGSLSSMT
jgi:hypothetical protein